MAKMYRKSGGDIASLVQDVMKIYYTDLLEQNIKIDLIDAYDSMGGPAVTVHGLPAAASIRVLSLKDRIMDRGDVEITFDGYVVDGFSKDEKMALIDHELYHIETKRNKDGQIKYDDIGRVEYKLKPHDREFGWFDAVARRWGKNSQEYKQANEMVSDEDFARIYLGDGEPSETGALLEIAAAGIDGAEPSEVVSIAVE
jgi:hypothetical protein